MDNDSNDGEGAPHWSVLAKEGSPFVDRLIDLSVEANLVPDRDFHYKWKEYGNWQLDTLKQFGLRPRHRLLDIGCGPLRLGTIAVPYLNEGNYFGIDAFPPYLQLGRTLLEEGGGERRYQLFCSPNFEFEKFSTDFDFAIAQSVFTHMAVEQISFCMRKLKPVMKKGATFVFTYFLTQHQRGIMYYGIQPMMAPLLADTGLFQRIARELDIAFETSDVRHPSQSVGVFRF